MRALLLTALLAALLGSAAAQRTGSAHFSGRSHFTGAHLGHSGFSRAYYPLGLSDPFYSEYLSTSGYPVASQPPLVILQSASPAVPENPPTPSQPLLIELQGDRYVQVSGAQSSQSQTLDSPAATKLAVRSDAPLLLTSSRPKSNVALLIFRDGHRQEVPAYTIAGGTLYASSDYATTGAWNQRIELSSLNLPETVSANNSRGQRFQLPSAPNEVIVGP